MSKKSEIHVSFNKEWVKKQKKEYFIKSFEGIYPFLKLDEIYDRIVGHEKKEKVNKK